ncbi:hypothetical protein GOP47_0025813 [Adiantum capillus-veneris]|uniref:Rubredoxin-like domain-containing protein n=1 Tax=Adiantum capillus-veneris TaxID=13818 RepID=A0A9D4U0Z7_ADICA|nr:hypothetical protein GOP47_0025813 [Adiantum capillus-veneris]
MAATSMGAGVGVPSLTNNNRGPILLHSTGGLRSSADKLALKSAFFNGASALLFPLPLMQHRISMRAATKGAYICRDCGYIYSDRKPFDKLSDDYRCPVCSAPKRRFKPYDIPVASNANQLDVRKARKAQLKGDDAIGSALPIGIAVGVAALVGVFLYLNTGLKDFHLLATHSNAKPGICQQRYKVKDVNMDIQVVSS